jgi:hypothetical protein
MPVEQHAQCGVVTRDDRGDQSVIIHLRMLVAGRTEMVHIVIPHRLLDRRALGSDFAA